MKKIIVVIIFVLLLMTIINKSNEDLRIRVIANSDSEYDQMIKYDVVSILKNNIKPNDTKKDIENKMSVIKEEVDKYLSIYNFDYYIGILDVEYEAKELNGKIIESGIYETLLVKIGKGEGRNWWSLLYPEYFDISFEDIEGKDVIIKSYFFEKLFK